MAPTTKMWHKRYLIPFWIVQLIVLAIYFVLACIGLSLVDDAEDILREDSSYSSSSVDAGATVSRAYFALIVGFTTLCLLFIFAEIGLSVGHRLKPAFHLSSACIKAFICLVWFILNVAAVAAVGRGYAVNIVLSLAIMLSTVLQVVYGSIVVHRVRKGYYNNLNVGSGNYGPVTYKGQGQQDVELQTQGVTYR